MRVNPNEHVILEVNEADLEAMKTIISMALEEANMRDTQINILKTELRYNEILDRYIIRVPYRNELDVCVNLAQTWHGSSVCVSFVPDITWVDRQYTTVTTDVETAYISAAPTITPTLEFVSPLIASLDYGTSYINYDNSVTIGTATAYGRYDIPESQIVKKPMVRPMDRPDFEYREEDYKELDEFLQSLA